MQKHLRKDDQKSSAGILITSHSIFVSYQCLSMFKYFGNTKFTCLISMSYWIYAIRNINELKCFL